MRVLWPYGDHTCWDQGLVCHLVEGRLWPGSLSGERERPDAGPVWRFGGEGAVVVLHGEVTQRDGHVELVEELVRTLPWAVVIHTSDERLTFDSGRLRRASVRTWMQMLDPQGRDLLREDGFNERVIMTPEGEVFPPRVRMLRCHDGREYYEEVRP